MPTSTDTVQQLVRQLYGLGLVQREINRHALAQLGSQGFAALAIVGLHGPLRVSDVAARLHVDLSVASRQVAALDRAGHVTRSPDGDDRRALVVALTDGGRDVLRDTHRRMVDGLQARPWRAGRRRTSPPSPPASRACAPTSNPRRLARPHP